MSKAINLLIEAEQKAATLFREIENSQLIRPGKTEREINQEVYDMAFKLFGIKKYSGIMIHSHVRGGSVACEAFFFLVDIM